MLTILDEYTRECHVLRADRALKSSDVLEWIGRAIAEHGSPPTCGVTMVPSLSPRKSSDGWPPTRSRRSISSPAVRGKMASSRVSMDACATSASNREQLWTLTEARVVMEDYRCQYNHYRPHSKLATKAQNVSRPQPKAFHLRLQSPPGLLTPQLDKPRQTT